MALSEVAGINFVLGAWLFVRALAKTLITYTQDDDFPSYDKIKSTGLEKPLPKDLPSVIDLKKVIPKQCFSPTVIESMYYVFKDISLVAISYGLIKASEIYLPNWVHWPCLILYWAVQGTLFTAIFVLGHDCGHQSFSHYWWLNDLMGNLLHCFILVPYTQWKLSHKHHHKHTGNFDKDEVFYPVRESDNTSRFKVIPGFGLGIGWFGYIIRGYGPRCVYHLNLNDSMFSGHKLACTLTLICNVCYIYLQYWHFSIHGGFIAWLKYYFIPVFIFGGYIVTITFLHHSEVGLSWFQNEKWDFVKGQLQTVDRHYGIFHGIIHNIGTHQIHHVFIKIPHYRLELATSAFRKAYPQLVRICEEPIFPSFMRMFDRYNKQKIIPDNTEQFTYK